MSLSDLELVQQAMAPTEPGAQEQVNARPAVADNAGAAGAPSSKNGGATAAPATAGDTASTSAPDSTDKDPLEGMDLSHLSEADRAALQPVLDALKAAAGKEGEDGGELDVEDILKQLEAAGDVADTLEGRLDTLLANLAEIEAAQHANDEEK